MLSDKLTTYADDRKVVACSSSRLLKRLEGPQVTRVLGDRSVASWVIDRGETAMSGK